MAFDEAKTYTGLAAVATDDNISANLLDYLAFPRGVVASRPVFGNKGAVYVASDEEETVYYDDGTQWVTVGKLVNSSTQTFNGVKTFGSIPVGPASNPTTANQLARKQYVDDSLSNQSLQSTGTWDNTNTNEQDVASINITAAGGLLFLAVFLSSAAGQGGGFNHTIIARFYDPSGLVSFIGISTVAITNPSSWSSQAFLNANSVSVSGGDTTGQSLVATGAFKPTQTGIHRITIQRSGSAGNFGTGNAMIAWCNG